MATFTTRLGLRKPTDAEQSDVDTDLNNNWDAIDAAIGFTVCTAATRPAAPFAGQRIRETDTSRIYVHNGTAPASAGWEMVGTVNGLIMALGKQLNIGSSGSTAPLAVLVAGGTDTVLTHRATGDTNSRFAARADGQLLWGSGSVAGDTNLYRAAADELKTDDNLTVGGIVGAVNARLGRPYVHMYQTSTQNLTTAVWAAMVMQAEVLDTISGHSTVSNQSRFTPNVPGWYRVTGQMVFNVSTAGDRGAAIYKNGATVVGQAPYGGQRAMASISTLFGIAQCHATLSMNGSSDYMELFGVQDSGGTLATSVASSNSYLIAEWIAPL